MFKSNQKTQAEIQTLAKYFETRADGDTVTWVEVETATGLSMAVSGHGRQNVRRALRVLKRPYETLVATGVRLSAPASAMTIVRGRFARIDGAVRVADRTQRQLQERHLEQMAADDQRRMLIAAGFFGAIRAYTKEARVKLIVK